MQERLLDILRTQFEEAEVRNMEQRVLQKNWNEFTESLEEVLMLISMNSTDLMRDLFTGLLSLQSLTRDSTRLVNDEVQKLAAGMNAAQEKLRDVKGDIDILGNSASANIEELAATAWRHLSLV